MLGGLFASNQVQTIGTFSEVRSFIDSPTPAGTSIIEAFGFEIKAPAEWMFDKFKENIGDMFLDYLAVSPIVIGVAAAVYVLVGMFSKTLGKLGVVGIFIYSIGVFLFG